MVFQFIEPEIESFKEEVQQPASYIRKEFEVTGDVAQASVAMTALGMYVPYLNGEKLTEEMLLPGFTDYGKRVQYQQYDITRRLRSGKNIIGCVLGDGWYRGSLGAFNKRNVYGKKTKFACQLEIQYTDGTELVLCTNDTWEATQDGALRENDLKIVENYDARKELTGWTSPGADESRAVCWHRCVPASYDGEVIPMQGERVVEKERFQPKVLHTPDGNTVLDFGQNLAGHVAFTVTGHAGQSVSLVMGEALDEQGNFTLKNLQGEGKGAELMPVGQRLNYTLREGTQSYSSTFLISGYQYALLENWPEEVRAENFTSIAIYSDLRPTGTFACSEEPVNRFVQNVLWSQKSNFVDIPTDCPQRERAGWAGDINVFLEAADYVTDTRKFIRKWMADFVAAQERSGALPYIIPKVPVLGAGVSSAGWSDAVSTVPLTQYLFYGDEKALADAYDAVKKFVDYNRKRALRRHLLNIYRIDPSFNYILDTGFHYGEWLEPGGSNIRDAIMAMLRPDPEVATAWFYYTTKNLVTMAKILGKTEDEQKYALLAQKIRDAYRREFIPGGQIYSHRQCRYVRAIYVGLAEEAEIPQIADRLNKLCIANHYKIGTGFLTTYRILQVLTDCGYAETAYRMLENEECPGWLYELKNGASTVWEGWDAIDPRSGKLKPLSLNHYAPGAAISWLYSHCAGIRPLAPGFRKIEIHPVPGGKMTWAKAAFESQSGRIASEWETKDGTFTLRVSIPDGVEATVILPDGSVCEHAHSGEYTCEYRKE